MDEQIPAMPERIEARSAMAAPSSSASSPAFRSPSSPPGRRTRFRGRRTICFGIVPLVVGVILELVAGRYLLDPRSLELAATGVPSAIFMTGVILVGTGVAAALPSPSTSSCQRQLPGGRGGRNDGGERCSARGSPRRSRERTPHPSQAMPRKDIAEVFARFAAASRSRRASSTTATRSRCWSRWSCRRRRPTPSVNKATPALFKLPTRLRRWPPSARTASPS